MVYKNEPQIIVPTRVPVFDTAAGKLRKFDDMGYPVGESDAFNYAMTDDPNAFMLRVHGESMIGADIADGNLVLVEPNKPVQNGDIVFCHTEQGVTIKKFFRQNNHIILQPLNPEQEPIIVRPEDNPRCYRVTQVIKKL